MQAIADPQYFFGAVNRFLSMAGQEALFDVRLVGAKSEIKLSNGQDAIYPDFLLEEVESTDLVIVPALFGDMKSAIEANRSLIPWVRAQYKNGAEVASLCAGAFLLASTGLLDGQKCSTHWDFTNEFLEMFPSITIQDGSIVSEEGGIYSGGGANSYWNRLLHLVEKYTNRETAIMAAKYFAIDIDRNNQSAFSMFKGQKELKDELIMKPQEYIESLIEERISVDDLAARVALGRRSFERRFKQATRNSVPEYIQRVKTEAAKRSFEGSRKNITEVMFDVGYTDTKAFRSTFKKITGLTPLEYRNKYNKLSLA